MYASIELESNADMAQFLRSHSTKPTIRDCLELPLAHIPLYASVIFDWSFLEVVVVVVVVVVVIIILIIIARVVGVTVIIIV